MESKAVRNNTEGKYGMWLAAGIVLTLAIDYFLFYHLPVFLFGKEAVNTFYMYVGLAFLALALTAFLGSIWQDYKDGRGILFLFRE